MPVSSGCDAEAVVDASEAAAWWKTAVVYQVYIRSFADSDGDGIGDVNGLRHRLTHLRDLGVDALWINPWYASPMADAGYDVADYRAIEPAYGDLDQAQALIREAHAHGLRVILDIVPNHTSSEHAWFTAALAGDEAARARYIFRPGRGPDGADPPNDWESTFGGPAWTRVPGPDGKPGDYYLHLFAPGQPDLDWGNPEVRDEFDDILRFWFDHDVDGFRIDVAHGLAKHPGLPDAGPRDADDPTRPHPAWDQDAVHEIYRRWRRIADSYTPPRVFVAEAWVPDNERLALYLRPDELHTAFQFDFLRSPFRADLIRDVVDNSLETAGKVGAVSTWVLSNHDVPRHLTRYARSQPDHLVEAHWDRARWPTEEADLVLGERRARAIALVSLALPGTAYIYQGEELGLPEVEDIVPEARQDPIWRQSGFSDPGRDGSRVPLPWEPTGPTYGFSPPDATAAPWLPQPPSWSRHAASEQAADPASTLNLYRAALRLRRDRLGGDDAITWLPTPDGVLAFRRGGVECWLNTGAADIALPTGEVLVASGPVRDGGALPPDTAAWIEVS